MFCLLTDVTWVTCLCPLDKTFTLGQKIKQKSKTNSGTNSEIVDS